MSTPNDLIDAVAAAEHLGVQASTVRQWVRRYGVVAHGRDGRRVLYSLSDLYDAEARARASAKAGTFVRSSA